MKKYISKIMFILAVLFFGSAVFVIGGVVSNNIPWHDTEQIILLILIAFSGLFLGLYRIIDLLEKKERL